MCVCAALWLFLVPVNKMDRSLGSQFGPSAAEGRPKVRSLGCHIAHARYARSANSTGPHCPKSPIWPRIIPGMIIARVLCRGSRTSHGEPLGPFGTSEPSNFEGA